ncbi:o-succinylbenzoic acid (OSB) synthetase [Oceanisphaera sp. W20_SRM_FM3]|uniref:o-succinylbenzoic acid (OSB) synthetase n=1 Tax=Oceanisphaera sp. W20_SRM_FM3 TaxID=3240267 RepID=UPI003F97929F
MLINLYHYQLPLTFPLTINGATVAVRDGFYVEIDGHWGEVAAPIGENEAAVLRDLTAACEHLRQGRRHEAELPAVQFGLDCALAKISTMPLFAIASLPLLEGSRDPLVRAWRCRRIHPERAWLILTGDVHYDAGLIRELCMLAPKVRLVLDAGACLHSEQIIDLWSRIETRRIDWLLDPTTELAEAQTLSRLHSIPVGLDLARYADFASTAAADLSNAEFAKAVIVRPAQLGGLAHNQTLVAQGHALGLEVMLGDSLQSGLGQHQLAHLSYQWLPDAPLALGRCRYLLDSGVDDRGKPQIAGLTPL